MIVIEITVSQIMGALGAYFGGIVIWKLIKEFFGWLKS